jgi:hypothetical protein
MNESAHMVGLGLQIQNQKIPGSTITPRQGGSRFPINLAMLKPLAENAASHLTEDVLYISSETTSTLSRKARLGVRLRRRCDSKRRNDFLGLLLSGSHAWASGWGLEWQ